ncbi:MAG: hypothetical protein FD180_4896 [Planctomycetota bacterium]|nr:MAG: hypothetical protein FD180_4896 [Planctomycetota bacterium]
MLAVPIRQAIAGCVLLAASAFADTGPKPSSWAEGVVPCGDLEGVTVEMSAEEVDLVLRKGDAREGGDQLVVKATFHMINHGDQVAFEHGFPVGPTRNMTGFSATFDGSNVEAKLVDLEGGAGVEMPEGKSEEDEREGKVHRYWYTWNQSYRREQKADLVVAYTLGVWHFSEVRNAAYLLRTGAGWKNTIGKAVITLRCEGGLTLDHLLRLAPVDGAAHHGDHITWTFEDFEPGSNHDIQFWYNRSETRASTIEKTRKDAKRNWDSRLLLVDQLEDVHHLRCRKTRTAAELKDYLDALASKIDGIKETEGRFVLPLPGMYMKEKDGAHFLLNSIDLAIIAVRDYPQAPQAREVLERYMKVVRAFIDGNLYFGGTKLEYSEGIRKGQINELNDRLKAAQDVLGKSK